ncbi:MAG: cytidine deaminase [Proteobacteria bacterium]|nr:cytidine deaminase [Pseudomonadota bacterium]
MTTTKQLIKQAQAAMKKAYAPYSKFHVGAVILDNNNNSHAGCNVENAAYPLGVCAEASAISSMVLSGGRVIKEIMLVSSGENLVTPCGGCRQKIKEFSDGNTKIQVFHNNGITEFSIEDLLPHSFSKAHLQK